MTYRKTIDTVSAFKKWRVIGVESVGVSHGKDTTIETKPDTHHSVSWQKDRNRRNGSSLASINDERMIDSKIARVRIEYRSLHKGLLGWYCHRTRWLK